MGVERTDFGGETSLLRELLQPGVKNTFLHYDCDEDGIVPKAAGLCRYRTDPGIGPTSSDDSGFVSEKQGAAQRGAWAVEGRKFRGKDTRLAKTFAMAVGAAAAGEDSEKAPVTDFVVILVPRAVNKRRGGASFSAAKGKGFVQVKCNDPPNLDLDLSVSVGDNFLSVRHNFEQAPMCTMPGGDIFFESALDEATDSVEVFFQVEPHGLPLARRKPATSLDDPLPECSVVEEETASFQESDDEAHWPAPGTAGALQAWYQSDSGVASGADSGMASGCNVQAWVPGSSTWCEAVWPVVFAPAEGQAMAFVSADGQPAEAVAFLPAAEGQPAEAYVGGGEPWPSWYPESTGVLHPWAEGAGGKGAIFASDLEAAIVAAAAEAAGSAS